MTKGEGTFGVCKCFPHLTLAIIKLVTGKTVLPTPFIDRKAALLLLMNSQGLLYMAILLTDFIHGCAPPHLLNLSLKVRKG